MNFLLHRHLGARDLGSSLGGLGATLPDLWRMADRRVRPCSSRPAAVEGASLEMLLRGIDHHVAADRWFHDNDVFLDGEREATLYLREARLSARRSVLFAHVLWELCLDGELLGRVGAEPTAAALDEDARMAGAGLHESAMLHHFSRTARTDDDLLMFRARLDEILRALGRGPWLESYLTGRGIAAIVDGMRTRVGLERMAADDLLRLAEVAGTLRARAAGAVDRILTTPSFAT